MPNYSDILAGVGGLSVGSVRIGFTPVAHVEIYKAACYTLKTTLQISTDNNYFESVSGSPSRTTTYKQIGNAVPVLLVKKIAALLEAW